MDASREDSRAGKLVQANRTMTESVSFDHVKTKVNAYSLCKYTVKQNLN